MIMEMFFQENITQSEEIFITSERHVEAFKNALEALNMVKESIEGGMPEDLYTIDLMNAYEELGRIIGENAGRSYKHDICRVLHGQINLMQGFCKQ